MDRAFSSKLREERAQECFKCLLPIPSVQVPLLVQGAMRMRVTLKESPGLRRSGQPLSGAMHLDMGGGLGLGIMEGCKLPFLHLKMGMTVVLTDGCGADKCPARVRTVRQCLAGVGVRSLVC